MIGNPTKLNKMIRKREERTVPQRTKLISGWKSQKQEVGQENNYIYRQIDR